ncbi:hypothetical protein DOY81_001361 [Sarcophaga bullata]|nr:hypothetical protein DOY81_001361 [Sarcophaga bullata]
MQKASHIAQEDSQENIPKVFTSTVNMKRRTLSGSCAVGFFVLAFGFIAIAFATPNWLRRFFVGCRWVYDPFTTGYDEIRGFLLPAFMIATQFFFTLAFIGMLVSGIGVLIFFLCAGPDQKFFIKLIQVIGYVILGAGISASIAVIIFASLGNRNNWMPEHANNWFGWSFILACIGSVMALVAAPLFLTEANVQRRKRALFKESQTRFEMMHGVK